MVRGLLNTRSLFLRLHAGVPESYYVNDVLVNDIHQLVQTVDDDATVGSGTSFKQWVNLADVWAALQLLRHASYFQKELPPALGAELVANVLGYLVSLPVSIRLPYNLYTF